MMKPAFLLLVVAILGGSFADQLPFNLEDGYLPPVIQPCPQRQDQISYETRVITSQVVQPIYIATTRTAFAQAIATATMAQMTRMVQTETRQAVVPVTMSFEITSTSLRQIVNTIQVTDRPVTREFIQTQVIPSTLVNRRTETRFQTNFQTISRFNTQFSTAFQTQTQVQNVQSTAFFTQPAFVSTVFQTQQDIRTQTQRLPDFFSEVVSTQVQQSQLVNFITPRPFIVTSSQVQTRVQTQVQQVQRTQEAFTTVAVTRTQFDQRIETSFVVQTSNVFSNRVQTVTSTFARIFTMTQVVPQYVTSTQVVNSFNQQFVTLTQTSFITETQTVQGQNQQITQVVTVPFTQVQYVTSTINNFQQSTVESVVTQPCSQVVTPRPGYNYNRPSNPLIF